MQVSGQLHSPATSPPPPRDVDPGPSLNDCVTEEFYCPSRETNHCTYYVTADSTYTYQHRGFERVLGARGGAVEAFCVFV